MGLDVYFHIEDHLWRETPPTTTPRALKRSSIIVNLRARVFWRNVCVAFVILWPCTITITITNPKSTILIQMSTFIRFVSIRLKIHHSVHNCYWMAAPTNENLIIFFTRWYNYAMCWVNHISSNSWGWASSFSKFEVSVLHQFFKVTFLIVLMETRCCVCIDILWRILKECSSTL